MIVQLTKSLHREFESLLVRLRMGRPKSRRRPEPSAKVLAFFDPAPAPLPCPSCGRIAGSSPKSSRGGVQMSTREAAASLLIIGALGGWAGWRARGAPARPISAEIPDKPGAVSTSGPTGVAPTSGRKETGALWTIYTSADRLSGRLLFGARLGSPGGPELFTVLCGEGQTMVALGGVISAPEGGSGNAQKLLGAMNVARRVGVQRERTQMRFDQGAAEQIEAVPPRPAEFLRRVASSEWIRTAAYEFKTGELIPALERIRQDCGLQSDMAPAQPSPPTKK